MSLKLMYITNDVAVAKIAYENGVDRIFVDLEKIGKQERQGGMNTVQSQHSFSDIRKIRNALKNAELLVRSNPVHDGLKEEIDTITECGADIIMLPYFKTTNEVEKFIKYVNGRAKTCLLFETPEAVEIAEEIISLDGIDEVFIGLNDLSLGYKKRFMFELLADGTAQNLAEKFKNKKIPFGFGGIAAIGTGTLPAEVILKEHYRLDSGAVILSRSFCNYEQIGDVLEVERIFKNGLKDLREYENKILDHKKAGDAEYFESNRRVLKEIVEQIKNK